MATSAGQSGTDAEVSTQIVLRYSADVLIIGIAIQRPTDTHWDIYLNGGLCKEMHNQRLPLASRRILGMDVV